MSINCVVIYTFLATCFGFILNETSTLPPRTIVYKHMTALFGVQTHDSRYEINGPLVVIDPVDGCINLDNGYELENAIVLVKWGSCDDIEKALNVDYFGGVGMVVGNDEGDTLYAMSSKRYEDIHFPCVFVGNSTFNAALHALRTNPTGTVFATISKEGDVQDPDLMANFMEIVNYLFVTFPAI